jgi:hypothetical protein
MSSLEAANADVNHLYGIDYPQSCPIELCPRRLRLFCPP